MTERSATENQSKPGTGAVAKALFPPGPAAGSSFVGRSDELKRLTDDVLTGRHSWFDCPPRYGVSTLTDQMRRELRNRPAARMHFVTCRLSATHDAISYCESLLVGAGQLASEIIGRPHVQSTDLGQMFPGVDSELYLDQNLLHTVRFKTGTDPVTTLLQVARRLDRLAGEKNSRCVFHLRDMQQIIALRQRDQLLMALKDIIESAENTTWLIHGHNRHAMQQLFSEDAILHRVCRRFTLRPINASLYAQYFAKAAQYQWRCNIGHKATAMILSLTGRHPYWLNQLCQRLWCSDLPPVIQDVVNEWVAMVTQQRFQTGRELERLSPNQRAVLLCLAQTPTDQPRAKSFVHRTRVSSASVGQAIKILMEQDLIRTNRDGVWSVTDPVMQWSLHPRSDIVERVYDMSS